MAGGEPLDPAVFDRFAARLSYLSGDFADPATFERLADAIDGARSPVFYLEIPPFLFGAVVKGLAGAGLIEGARVVVEKPFGHDLESARALAAEMHEYLDESQLYRIDHFLGQDGPRRDPLPAVRERDARAGLEPQLPRVRPDHDGRELRRRGPRALLRPRRRAARRRRQPHDAGRRRGRDGGPGGPRPDDDQGRRSRGSSRPCRPPTRRTTCAASTTATATSPGVAPDSTTETYAAMRLEIDNWRWSGVPFFLRTGKRLPVTQTELRLVFKRPPRLGFHAAARTARAGPADRQARPHDRGPASCSTAQRGDPPESRTDPPRHGVRRRGRRGRRRRTRCCCTRRCVGDASRFTRQDGVEEAWRVMAAAARRPAARAPVRGGSWGPPAADRLVAGHGRWHEPWVAA